MASSGDDISGDVAGYMPPSQKIELPATASTYSPYFNSDRAAKYGWGLPRLVLLCVIGFEVAPRVSCAVLPGQAAALHLLPYLRSGRWMGHLYIGSIGAVVNVQIRSAAFNIMMLLVAATFIVFDLRLDYSILIYMLKTFSGDFVAGKLDTLEWRLVLLFTAIVTIAVWQLEAANAPVAFQPYMKILPALATVQLICELGDAHLEHSTAFGGYLGLFFRHRYSFEILSSCVLFGGLVAPQLALTPTELQPVLYDLVICLGYRASNLTIILARSGDLMLASRRVAFRVLGLLVGQHIEIVHDANVAMAVLRSSSVKGLFLERQIASPAWSPVLSLESIDGPLYTSMIGDFHKLLKYLPPAATFAAITEARVDSLLKSATDKGSPIDADAIATVTVLSTVRYLFGRGSGAERDRCVIQGASLDDVCSCLASESALVERLVRGSWEWRKEIAVRGKADPTVKSDAIDALLTLLRGSEIWDLHGDSWALPRYYSLLMQPFLLSPAINIGDIAVAFKQHPTLSAEDAVRVSHPFPILERFVGPDGVLMRDGSKAAIRPNTQVIIFTPDLVTMERMSWPIFGAGPRACQGTQFALPLINLLHAKVRTHPAFDPKAGHLYSGRNNDAEWSWKELSYYIRTIGGVLLSGSKSQALRHAEAEVKAEVVAKKQL